MSEAPEYLIEVLDATRHRREEFSCESPALTDFLHKQARKEMKARASACFVLVSSKDPGRVVGYYTLSQTSISLTKIPEAIAKKLPHYPEFGATLIGRLARDIEWRGQRIGPLLLVDALRRSVRVSREVGAVVGVTDSKDGKARAFYERYAFKAVDERRMFIPMKELLEREAKGWTA